MSWMSNYEIRKKKNMSGEGENPSSSCLLPFNLEIYIGSVHSEGRLEPQ